MAFRDRIKELRRVRAGELLPHPKNWRRHPQQQRDALKAMLERVGFAGAAIVRETPEGLQLIDGHERADLDPEAMIPVLVTDVDEQEAEQLLASFDPLGAMAMPDLSALDALLADMPEVPPIDYEALYPPEGEVLSEGRAGPADDTEREPPPDPVTQPGDLWVMGKHRLLCGDCTDKEAVSRLLNGDKPNLMVTDPPYGVDYDPDWRNRADRANGSPIGAQAVGTVHNDDRTDWKAAWALFPGAVAYVWHPPGADSVQFYLDLELSGFEIRMQMIWAKNQFPIGRGHYHVKHEPCWYAVRKGETASWLGDRSQNTLWEIAKPHKSETGHSTQKPVECMERPIRNHAGDVYDPFVGSGTTIIAAERQNRACYAMEIDPGYCDVAVSRWEDLAGEQAVREQPG